MEEFPRNVRNFDTIQDCEDNTRGVMNKPTDRQTSFASITAQ